MTPDLTPSRIPAVTDSETERQAAGQLVLVEKALRQLEERRTDITRPLNASLKKINEEVKVVAVPLEAKKAELQAAMGEYRLQPKVQEMLARRDRMEKMFRHAERDGDERSMREVAPVIALINEELPRTVKVEGSDLSVRYRSSIEIDSINEDELPEEFFTRTPDVKRIKAQIETLGSVPGVEHRYVSGAYCVRTGEPEV